MDFFDEFKTQFDATVNELRESGEPLVADDIWERRISICRGCEFWDEFIKNTGIGICKQCGCPSVTFKVDDTNCPINKWN